MAISKLRQDDQVLNSETYDDTLAAGATLESAPTNLQDDLDALRSQIKRVLGQTNWYDAVASRDLATVDTDLDTLETSRRLCQVENLTDVSVSAGQNFEILDNASGETPSTTAAVGAVTTLGAVCALSAVSGASFGTNELLEVAGPNAIRPKNLLSIRDATTGQRIQSSGRDVFGLLQIESTASDGDAFDDVSGGSRAKISFVRMNAALDDLEACPIADIAGRTINYVYFRRYAISSLPEDCGVVPTFTDHAAAVDVTLDTAIDNQSGAATQAQDIDVDIANTFAWAFRDGGSADMLRIYSDTAGGNSEVEVGAAVDLFNVDAVLNDFANGLRVNTGGTRIDIGETAGTIETPGGTDDLTLRAGQELFFDDANRAASAFSVPIKLSESIAEWTDFEAEFGEVSLIDAIHQAGLSGGTVTYAAAVVTASSISADTNVTGAGGTPNIDAQLADYSGVSVFEEEVAVFVNGQRMRGGADASANNDVYPGTTPANGDLRFERRLVAGDVLIMEVRA